MITGIHYRDTTEMNENDDYTSCMKTIKDLSNSDAV